MNNIDGIYSIQYNLRLLKPLEEKLLHEVFSNFKYIVTVEDGCIQGDMGSAILKFMSDNGYSSKVVRLGIPDKIIEHGGQPELWDECKYDGGELLLLLRDY